MNEKTESDVIDSLVQILDVAADGLWNLNTETFPALFKATTRDEHDSAVWATMLMLAIRFVSSNRTNVKHADEKWFLARLTELPPVIPLNAVTRALDYVEGFKRATDSFLSETMSKYEDRSFVHEELEDFMCFLTGWIFLRVFNEAQDLEPPDYQDAYEDSEMNKVANKLGGAIFHGVVKWYLDSVLNK